MPYPQAFWKSLSLLLVPWPVLPHFPGFYLSALGSLETQRQLIHAYPAWQQQGLQKPEPRWGEGREGSASASLSGRGQVHDLSGPQHLHPSVKGAWTTATWRCLWGGRKGSEGHAEGSQKPQPGSSQRLSLQLLHVLGSQGRFIIIFFLIFILPILETILLD